MSVSSTSNSSSSAASAALGSALGSTTGSSSLGEPDFLTLLVTQLQNQDPLNPMDDTTFVAQLAQFSSLQELTNLNTGMTNLLTAVQGQEAIGAANFIGKTVTATGSSLEVSGSDVSAAEFTLPSNESDVKVYVTDSSGNVEYTKDLGTQSAGAQTFQWDGTNSNGSKVSDGTYNIAVYATSSSGSTSQIATTVAGTVTGTENNNGTLQLILSDGRTVNFTDVQSVLDTNSSSSS